MQNSAGSSTVKPGKEPRESRNSRAESSRWRSFCRLRASLFRRFDVHTGHERSPAGRSGRLRRWTCPVGERTGRWLQQGWCVKRNALVLESEAHARRRQETDRQENAQRQPDRERWRRCGQLSDSRSAYPVDSERIADSRLVTRAVHVARLEAHLPIWYMLPGYLY
jgi:hypothetical protein